MLGDAILLGMEKVNPSMVTELELKSRTLKRDPNVIAPELSETCVLSPSDLGLKVEQLDLHALHHWFGLVPLGAPRPSEKHVARLAFQPAKELNDMPQFRIQEVYVICMNLKVTLHDHRRTLKVPGKFRR